MFYSVAGNNPNLLVFDDYSIGYSKTNPGVALRITGGEFRGRKLTAPKGRSTRPTSDKVREAIFGIIGQKIKGASFLDCFAGTGAMGIEAISRGSSAVTLVEKKRKTALLIRYNLENLGLEASVMVMDFFKAAENFEEKNVKWDLIFVDPPYKSLLQLPAVEKLACSGLIENEGTVIVEHDKHQQLPLTIGGLEQVDCRRYGETVLVLYQHLGRK